MKPNDMFSKQDKSFWACVRSISQQIGYKIHGEDRIKVHTIIEMQKAFSELNLNSSAICDLSGNPTKLAQLLQKYFKYRADILETVASKKLMNGEEARTLYEKYLKKYRPTRSPTMNKQKGDKKAPAFLTGLINMTIEYHSKGADCDYDPRKLTTITHNGVPLRTLARRVDGAFPNSVNLSQFGRSKNIIILLPSAPASLMVFMKPCLMEWSLKNFATMKTWISSTILWWMPETLGGKMENHTSAVSLIYLTWGMWMKFCSEVKLSRNFLG